MVSPDTCPVCRIVNVKAAVGRTGVATTLVTVDVGLGRSCCVGVRVGRSIGKLVGRSVGNTGTVA